MQLDLRGKHSCSREQRAWTGVTPGRAVWLLSQWLSPATLAALVSDDIIQHSAEVLSPRSLGMWLNRK